MRNTYSAGILFVLLLALASVQGTLAAPAVDFTVTADKSEYEVGETPRLTFSFLNDSQEDVTLSARINGNVVAEVYRLDGPVSPGEEFPGVGGILLEPVRTVAVVEVADFDPRAARLETLADLAPGERLDLESNVLWTAYDYSGSVPLGLSLELWDFSDGPSGSADPDVPQASYGIEKLELTRVLGPGFYGVRFTYEYLGPDSDTAEIYRGRLQADPVLFTVLEAEAPAPPIDEGASWEEAPLPDHFRCEGKPGDSFKKRCEDMVKKICNDPQCGVDCTLPRQGSSVSEVRISHRAGSPTETRTNCSDWGFPCSGQISNIQWDPDYKTDLGHGVCMDPATSLAHEIFHALQTDLVRFDAAPAAGLTDNGQPCEVVGWEFDAVNKENAFKDSGCGSPRCCVHRTFYLGTLPDGTPVKKCNFPSPPGTDVPICLLAGDVVFHISGVIYEKEWRRGIGGGSPLSNPYDCWTPKGPDGSETCPETIGVAARFGNAASGGSLVNVSFAGDGGSLSMDTQIMLSWINPGGLNFGWPWLEHVFTIEPYVLGPASTGYEVALQTSGSMANSEQTPWHHWASNRAGRIEWASPGTFNVTPAMTGSFSGSGLTAGTSVIIDGEEYHLALQQSERMYVMQNASWGGTHTGTLTMTTSISMTLPAESEASEDE